jgi:hypothetical protein
MNSAAAGSVELGRDAVKRHAWTEAVEAFAAADRDGGLSPEDLELMGEAAWWAGNPMKLPIRSSGRSPPT